MPNRTPPRYVPTLTEVVNTSAGAAPAAAAGLSQEQAGLSQEQLIARVMQRVDLALERRLREAIAATLLEQTRSIAPLLRDEIESVVRETVAQAFSEELATSERQKK